MVDGARAWDARLGRGLVIGVEPAATLASSLPAVAPGLEVERFLQQRAAGVGVDRVGADSVEPLQRDLFGHLGVVGDQRLVGDRRDAQLVRQALRIREAQRAVAALGLAAGFPQPLSQKSSASSDATRHPTV